ncbi:hypothetical protein D9M71_822980 [compost metagenome]
MTLATRYNVYMDFPFSFRLISYTSPAAGFSRYFFVLMDPDIPAAAADPKKRPNSINPEKYPMGVFGIPLERIVARVWGSISRW